jgi:flagellar biosynthetic protein FliR
VQALPVAGQIAAYMLGLSNVLQPDPVLGAQASVLARLFGLAAPVLLLASGLHAVPLAGLAASFRLIPPGQLLPAGDAMQTVVAGVAQAFALALRLASPFLLASIVWQVGTALMARLVPRLQIYMTAMPGQILGGLLLVGVLASVLAATWLEAVRDGLARLPGAG